MNPLSVIEKTEAYLNVHLTHSGPPGAASPAGPFVTLSRQSGTGGTELARKLATHLSYALGAKPWEVYSGNLIEELLRSNQLPSSLAPLLREDRISVVDASVGEMFGLHPDLWELVKKTTELLRALARTGHTILLGRGSNFATASIPHGVHVRLVADETTRAVATARRLSIGVDAAHIHNIQRDAARRRYVRANFDSEIADPTAYDMVLNVAQVSSELAVEMIATLVHARTGRPTALNEPDDSHRVAR